MTSKADVLIEIAQYEETYNAEQNKSIALNIYEQIDRMTDGGTPTAKEIAAMTVAMKEDLQVRDFVMGLPKERNIDYVGNWIAYVGQVTPKEYEAPVASIISSFYYSVGDKENAGKYIKMALEVDPSYSLAILLQRVYLADWPAESLAKMRDELHDKVKEEIGL
jgi:tetratricopeptide (TPR) repeat protein